MHTNKTHILNYLHNKKSSLQASFACKQNAMHKHFFLLPWPNLGKNVNMCVKVIALACIARALQTKRPQNKTRIAFACIARVLQTKRAQIARALQTKRAHCVCVHCTYTNKTRANKMQCTNIFFYIVALA